jgi:hypothetical protein
MFGSPFKYRFASEILVFGNAPVLEEFNQRASYESVVYFFGSQVVPHDAASGNVRMDNAPCCCVIATA